MQFPLYFVMKTETKATQYDRVEFQGYFFLLTSLDMLNFLWDCVRIVYLFVEYTGVVITNDKLANFKKTKDCIT